MDKINNMPSYDYKNMTPFKWFVLENFPFIEADFDALTNWQLFCKLGKEMNKVIDKVNECGEQVENLTNAYIELESYVNNFVEQMLSDFADYKDVVDGKVEDLEDYMNNYFDNLDVQEEINNKLDDMVEQGTLQEIIIQYLQVAGMLSYDNVASMKSATNLVNGSYVTTFGFYSKNDLGGAKYKVRTKTNDDTIDEILLIALNDNTLVAELVLENEMNINQFGAKGIGTYDDTIHIQKALDNCNNIFIPKASPYYKITDTLNLNTDQVIKGIGEKSKILMPNDLEETIFNIQNVDNILIDNIKLANEGTQSTSSPALNKNKIIYAENVNDLTIQNCYFQNFYSRGILIHKTKDFNFINNVIKNATYEMLMILPETENVLVDNCVFDTITSTYINSYLFATGRIDEETYEFSTKNVTVRNSKFLNNPLWEGIDTHGCNNFYCENNYIYNCKIGIMARYGTTAPVTSDSIKHGNIYINNNVLYASESAGIGIDAGVSAPIQFMAENININNNYVYGFGNSTSNGAINIIGSKYINANNNTILKSGGCGFTLTLLLNGNINENNIIDTNSDYGIHFIAGCWFLNLKNNKIKNNTINDVVIGIRGGYLGIYDFEGNEVEASNFLYTSNGTIMNGTINESSNQIGKIGCFAKDTYGFIKYYCTDTVVRPAKTTTNTSVSLSATAGTNIVTGSNALYYLTEGEEIILQGAGSGGVDLTTTITEFLYRDKFKVKDNIQTTITNSNPKSTASTWVQVT